MDKGASTVPKLGKIEGMRAGTGRVFCPVGLFWLVSAWTPA
jgi:hypothetical protein